jgi:hypothetical protein
MFDGRPKPHGAYEIKMHLQEMIDLFGVFPLQLLSGGLSTEKHFDKDGTIRDPLPLSPLTLEDHVEALEPPGNTAFVAMLRLMMKLAPEERGTADALLKEGWPNSAKSLDMEKSLSKGT